MSFAWITDQSIRAIGLFFAGLLLIAVVFETIRGRRRRKREQDEAWRTLEAIAKDKDLSTEEWDKLAGIIRRWSPADPRKAVAVSSHFDTCVESEMNQLSRNGDAKEFERTGAVLRDVRMRLGLDYVPIGQRITSTRGLFNAQEIFLARTIDSPPRWVRGQIGSIDEAYFGVKLGETGEEVRVTYRADEEVRIRLWRDGDARYMFTTRFVREEREPRLFIFQHCGNLNRVQSRDFYRVRHDQNTTVSIINAPVDGDEGNLRARQVVTKLRGRVTNVSAGGFAVVVQQAIPAQVNLRVTLEFDMPNVQPVTVDAKMIASSPLAGGRYLVRATYLGIDDETRDIIAHYVMHRQQAYLETTTPAE